MTEKYPMQQNPYAVVFDFEERIAAWAGSKYAVAVESGTAAIFLSLQYRVNCDDGALVSHGMIGSVDTLQVNPLISIPKHTYPGVPCSIIQAGLSVNFTDEAWSGVYELAPLKIIDGALRFRKGMYEGGLHCLSFHVKKLLPLGRGGMILTDDIEARDWLRRARFDGRNPVPLLEDNFTMLGYNMYMTPEQASRGIQLFEVIRNKELPDLRVEDQGYPDLSKFPIYNQ